MQGAALNSKAKGAHFGEVYNRNLRLLVRLMWSAASEWTPLRSFSFSLDWLRGVHTRESARRAREKRAVHSPRRSLPYLALSVTRVVFFASCMVWLMDQGPDQDKRETVRSLIPNSISHWKLIQTPYPYELNSFNCIRLMWSLVFAEFENCNRCYRMPTWFFSGRSPFEETKLYISLKKN